MSQSPKTLEFLQKLKDKGHWNDDYDYTKVIYINAKTSVILFNKLTEILKDPYQVNENDLEFMDFYEQNPEYLQKKMEELY